MRLAVLVEQTAEDGSTGDPLGWLVGDRMVRSWWPLPPRSVRPVAVVVPGASLNVRLAAAILPTKPGASQSL